MIGVGGVVRVRRRRQQDRHSRLTLAQLALEGERQVVEAADADLVGRVDRHRLRRPILGRQAEPLIDARFARAGGGRHVAPLGAGGALAGGLGAPAPQVVGFGLGEQGPEAIEDGPDGGFPLGEGQAHLRATVGEGHQFVARQAASDVDGPAGLEVVDDLREALLEVAQEGEHLDGAVAPAAAEAGGGDASDR